MATIMRYAPVLTAVAIGIALIGAFWWSADRSAPSLLGQEVPTPTPHPACAEEQPECVVFHNWPPFTLTYETDGNSIWEDGVNKASREVKRLVWNSNRDWRIDTLSADDIVLSFMTMNTTGSYEIFKDGIYTAYDASDGRPNDRGR